MSSDNTIAVVRRAAAALVALATVTPAQDPPREHAFTLAEVAPVSARISADNPLGCEAVELRAGARLRLPGATALDWAHASHLVADVACTGSNSGTLVVEFFGADDAPRIHAKIGLLPGLPTRVAIPLQHLDGQTFFLERRPRQLKTVMPGRRLDPTDITRVEIRLERGEEAAATVWVAAVRTTDSPPPPMPELPAPIVDRFGQWTARDWPGKTRSDDELITALRSLHASVAVAPPSIEGRSRYGGFTAVRFAATGFFRVERDERRWWLVDPEGCAFFSVGVDCVAPSSAGPIDGMEDLFEWLPDVDGPFSRALGGRRGRQEVSFVTANLIRAFGDGWRRAWEELAAGLLHRDGFDTVGNWSDREFATRARIPWVLPLQGFPSTRVRPYRDFPDVFADEYAEAARRFAAQMEAYRDDPYLIGYFLSNEPVWAFGANNLAAEMLATSARSATRDALVRWLRARHGDDVGGLAEAWGVDLASFDELATRALPGLADRSEHAREELWQFSRVMVDRYLRLPCQALREVAPHHLDLGIRYAWISSDLCYVGAGELFDVFSLNAYVDRPDATQVGEVTARTGLPVLIGEFHHGALDRGLPSTGIRGVPTQRDRGVAYRWYLEHAAAIPSLVGAHWFQWHDQPVLGRFDGENYQIGLVDVCHRPYEEFSALVRETNLGLLEVLSGRRRPTTEAPRTVRAIYF